MQMLAVNLIKINQLLEELINEFALKGHEVYFEIMGFIRRGMHDGVIIESRRRRLVIKIGHVIMNIYAPITSHLVVKGNKVYVYVSKDIGSDESETSLVADVVFSDDKSLSVNVREPKDYKNTKIIIDLKEVDEEEEI